MTEIYQALDNLKSNNVPIADTFKDDIDYYLDKHNIYNCWSFTELLHGWSDSIKWQSCVLHRRVLGMFTYPIIDRQVGDVVVFSCDWGYCNSCGSCTDRVGELSHTATIVDFEDSEPVILDKYGKSRIRVDKISNIINSKDVITEYRRPCI